MSKPQFSWSANYRYYAIVDGKRVGPLLPYTPEGRIRAERIAMNVRKKANGASCGIGCGQFTDDQLAKEKQD